MKRFVLFVLVAGLVLAVGSAWATTVIDFKTGSILSGSGTIGNGGWSVAKDGDPWWDNKSTDPANKNIGDMLLGASEPAFTPQSLASPPGALPYLYGTNTATAVTASALRHIIAHCGYIIGNNGAGAQARKKF